MYKYRLQMSEMSKSKAKSLDINMQHCMETLGWSYEEYQTKMFGDNYYQSCAQDIANHAIRRVREEAGDNFLHITLVEWELSNDLMNYTVLLTSSLDPKDFQDAFGSMWDGEFYEGYANLTDVTEARISLQSDAEQGCIDHVFVRNSNVQPMVFEGKILGEFKCKNCDKAQMSELQIR